MKTRYIKRIIKEDWNLPWKEDDRDNRLVTYITTYNKKNEDNVRLGLWPNKVEGQKRVYRYKKIVLLNRKTEAA